MHGIGDQVDEDISDQCKVRMSHFGSAVRISDRLSLFRNWMDFVLVHHVQAVHAGETRYTREINRC